MANYVVEPSLLEKHLPYQTELDLWEGKCYVSMVGFMFKNTRVLGIPIPWHINFEEVNLRFYVRHKTEKGEWRRGVVFIKEIVPRRAITFVANKLYGEHYHTMPMDHECIQNDFNQQITYRWKYEDHWNHLRVICAKEALSIREGSEAAFITEHYWGYTRLGPKKTSEYEVVHPSWNVYTVEDYDIQYQVEKIYGEEFAEVLKQKPYSVFMADGSKVAVRGGRQI